MLRAIYANIRDFYDRIFWQDEQTVTEYGEGYVLNYGGKPWLSGINQLWVDDPTVVNPALFDYSQRFFRAYQAEWSIFVLPDRLHERRDNVGWIYHRHAQDESYLG